MGFAHYLKSRASAYGDRPRTGFEFLIFKRFFGTLGRRRDAPGREWFTTLSRLRLGLFCFACALLLPAGGAFAQTCSEPSMGPLPAKAKAGKKLRLHLTGMTPGGEYLLKVRDWELLAGVAAGDTVTRRFKMPDFGAQSQRVNVVVITAHDLCDNSPWKLKQPINFVAPAPKPAATPKPRVKPAPASPAPTPKPSAAVKPQRPARPQPVKPVHTPAAKPAAKQQPQQPVIPAALPKNARAWITPFDPEVRAETLPKDPILPPSLRPVDPAKSTFALVALGSALAFIALIAGIALYVLNRRDSAAISKAEEEGRLPYHLSDKELEPEIARIRDRIAPKRRRLAFLTMPSVLRRKRVPKKRRARALPEPILQEPAAHLAPVAGEEEDTLVTNGAHANGLGEPVGTNGNGSHGVDETVPGEHRARLEAELQTILNEAGIPGELDGILAEARDEAERQGVAVDPELMLQALCGEVNGSASISGDARSQLMAKFQEIVAEERERVPQPHG